MGKTEKELRQEVEKGLKNMKITTLSTKEIEEKYKSVLGWLDELVQQPMEAAEENTGQERWDIRILKHAGGRITAMKGKLVEAANELFLRRPEAELFSGSLALQGAGTRGTGEKGAKKLSAGEQFFIPIDGGKLEIILEKREGEEAGLKIKIAVISEKQPVERVKEFYCTIEDAEEQQIFFADKRVEKAYMNDRIDDGVYRITVQSGEIRGSAVVKIGEA